MSTMYGAALIADSKKSKKEKVNDKASSADNDERDPKSEQKKSESA